MYDFHNFVVVLAHSNQLGGCFATSAPLKRASFWQLRLHFFDLLTRHTLFWQEPPLEVIMIWKSAVCLPWKKVSCLITSVAQSNDGDLLNTLARQLCITIDLNWRLFHSGLLRHLGISEHLHFFQILEHCVEFMMHCCIWLGAWPFLRTLEEGIWRRLGA